MAVPRKHLCDRFPIILLFLIKSSNDTIFRNFITTADVVKHRLKRHRSLLKLIGISDFDLFRRVVCESGYKISCNCVIKKSVDNYFWPDVSLLSKYSEFSVRDPNFILPVLQVKSVWTFFVFMNISKPQCTRLNKTILKIRLVTLWRHHEGQLFQKFLQLLSLVSNIFGVNHSSSMCVQLCWCYV